MKTAEEQIQLIQQYIEGVLNDFESGETDKDEAIVLLREYVYERAGVAVKNRNSEIISKIDEMIEDHGLEGDQYHQALTEIKEKL